MSLFRKRAFVSFDFDHDARLKDLLVGQAKNPDTPFNIADWSLKDAVPGDWERVAEQRLRAVDVVIVLCGRFTHTARGVDTEITIARRIPKPYFLLAGYEDATKPIAASANAKLYKWTWDNLKKLIHGER